MMRLQPSKARQRVNRRSFLRGAAGVSVALPFLESLPDRSAWAADEAPVFALFVCASGGVVPEHFFPDTHGKLTVQGLADSGKAVAELAGHAPNLLLLSGVDFESSWVGDRAIGGMCMALTGQAPGHRESCESCPVGAGPSANWAVSSLTQPGTDPLVLLAGDPRAWGEETISFSAAGYRTEATSNPYDLYRQLVGLLPADGGTTPDGERATRLLRESRKSVHDLVRDELKDLLAERRLSATDRQRLQLHFDSIREVEVAVNGCSYLDLDVDQLEGLRDYSWDATRTEEMVHLHLSLVSIAFACNHRRAASLQWGNANDRTVYDVASNARGWWFTHISHRMQSDVSVGDDALAAQAHAEIDVVRMRTLSAGLDQFRARGLADNSLVMWTNAVADGPSHSLRSVPHIVWGSGGGYLKQGQYVDAGGTKNNQLLNTLITAAVRDKGISVNDFGQGVGGQLSVALA